MKSLFAVMIKAVVFLAVIYFGIIMLIGLPRYLHDHAQENYQSIFIQPQIQTDSFENWAESVQTAIHNDQNTDVIKRYGVYLLLPSMREQYIAYYQNLISARQGYQALINKLEISFAGNQALKRSWEMAVLSKTKQKSISVSKWGEEIYRLLTNPAKSSEALLGFVKFNLKKHALEKQLSAIQQQFQNDSAALQTQLITK